MIGSSKCHVDGDSLVCFVQEHGMCVGVVVVLQEDVLAVAGSAGWHKAGTRQRSRRRRSGVCLSDFTPPINFTSLLPISLHTSHHFSIWAASERLTNYRPPAPSEDAEMTDGLHRY
jgi:hypothetical protein